MKTYGVIIWMKEQTGAMIVWCADSKGLAYVPPGVGHPATGQGAGIGDTVDLVLVGGGRGIRMCAEIATRAEQGRPGRSSGDRAGRGLGRGLGDTAGDTAGSGAGSGAGLIDALSAVSGEPGAIGPVISRDSALARSIGFGPEVVRRMQKRPAANRGSRVA